MVFALGMSAWSSTVSAEGRCPPGQYPIGGQGFAGCAPIPNASPQPPQRPQPTGKWLDRWGAISLSSTTGSAGTATGRVSRSEAVAEAQERCAASGAKDCKSSLSYKNQCAVLLGPAADAPAAERYSALAKAATVEEAIVAAQTNCGPGGRGRCELAFQDCAKPVFEEF